MVPTKETLKKLYDELSPEGGREDYMNVLRKLCEEPYGHKSGAYMAFDIPESIRDDRWDDVREDYWEGRMYDEGDEFEEILACDGDMAIGAPHGPYFFSELDEEEVCFLVDTLIQALMD